MTIYLLIIVATLNGRLVNLTSPGASLTKASCEQAAAGYAGQLKDLPPGTKVHFQCVEMTFAPGELVKSAPKIEKPATWTTV